MLTMPSRFLQILLSLFAITAFAAAADPKQEHSQITWAPFIVISTSDEKTKKQIEAAAESGNLNALAGEQDIEVYPLPRITTSSRQDATDRIVSELVYPTEYELNDAGDLVPVRFTTANLGVTLDLNGRMIGEDLVLSGKLVVRKATALINKPDNSTIGMTEQIIQFHRKTKPGAIAVIAHSGGSDNTPPLADEDDKSHSPTLLLAATPLDGKGNQHPPLSALDEQDHSTPGFPTGLQPSPSKPHPATSPAEPPEGTPVATWIRPGFVNSPHAPDSGAVDLRGFTPGTQVKCPYTGEIFLVPDAEPPTE